MQARVDQQHKAQRVLELKQKATDAEFDEIRAEMKTHQESLKNNLEEVEGILLSWPRGPGLGVSGYFPTEDILYTKTIWEGRGLPRKQLEKGGKEREKR